MKRGRIFLCDDDRDIVEVTRFILEKIYTVDVFYTCEAIISSAAEAQPDVILLDLWMPNEGGRTIAHKLKHHPLTNKIPVILFSAANDLSKIAVETEAAGYIAKPYDIEELVAVIENTISLAAAKK
jgi:DNA-binding response OmpR family regulator